VADPDEVWNLGLFQKEAYKAIRGIIGRHHLPFIVGGTGQFIRAITEGWSIPAQEPNHQLRKALTDWSEQIGLLELHKKLAILDPAAAESIDPTNLRRTIRALEVIFSTGRRFSEQRTRGESFINPLLLGLTCSREELYQRIDDRIAKMIEAGFVSEVQQLLEQGYSPDLPTLSAIGYGEIVAYLQGSILLEEAIISIKRRTRMFVRRQANWFKPDDPHIHWFLRNLSTRQQMEELISIWLKEIKWGKYP
jgi:tRNA dimethylallyltransferase